MEDPVARLDTAQSGNARGCTTMPVYAGFPINDVGNDSKRALHGFLPPLLAFPLWIPAYNRRE